MPSPKQRKVAIVGSRAVGKHSTTIPTHSLLDTTPAWTRPETLLPDPNPILLPYFFFFSLLLQSANACYAAIPGKSSLAVRFVDGHFVDSYYPTIENTFSKTIRFKGQDYLTEIVDTAGQDEYSILNSKHFIGIHGYILVYAVSSLASFEMVQSIRDKILNHLGTESVPIVIVGNKCDLRPEQRQVSMEDGRKLSDRLQCGWTEASAAYDTNVAKAFELMIAQIEKSQAPGEAPPKSNCTVM
ncbi:Ras-like protein enriched in brain [Geosmithia morbida]|uniref:Ras-like protein enriched in brain n=1 Tax=Geosmithia morbida TaxID=1094350 RepID=A0A9P4YR86_9HYPO|nr:Ras-like protein enriched in brain [Geosmithia morbida]KAF4120131.1 Ras-like protein enriched in brain [Geosmithia morbida]